MPDPENIQAEVEALCRYKVGDKVYYHWQITIDALCHFCEGSAEVTVKGKVKKCPYCNGKGVTDDYGNEVRGGVIQNILIPFIQGEPFYYLGPKNEGGWDATDIYPTREEAEAALAEKEGVK